MNNPEHNFHELLRQFENLNREGATTSPLQFIEQLTFQPSHAFQLEIIAVDIELSLTEGTQPPYEEYVRDFPWLKDEIPGLYADAIETFVRSFCPVRHRLGSSRFTDDYEIGDEIGRGGMGVVYEAVQKSVNRPVAMKVLFLSTESILDEAKKAAQLAHRNICRIYEAGTIGRFPFMTMQLIRGRSLKQLLAANQPSLESAISITVQIANALIAAHHANLVHFDVKPENIIVNPKGDAWLTDFGLSKQHSEITQEHNVLQPATVSFCAPEQLSMQFGERGVWSDVYSLGLVLYKLLCGRNARSGNYDMIVDQIKHDPPRRLVDYDARIPDELDAICRIAIEKNPANRFSSMQEFRETLLICGLKSGLLTPESVGCSMV